MKCPFSPMTFNEQVWKACRKIPKGRVSTYGELAQALGTKAYRAVGTALNKNPYSAWRQVGGSKEQSSLEIVPCHRVVKSTGELGGFAQGSERKRELLEKEGIIIEKGIIMNFKEKLFVFEN
jgi:methylated-DNA-[protein]-cysteine S-methyltransferase